MASKVRGFGAKVPESSEVDENVANAMVRNEPAHVSKSMLDEAVEVTLEGATREHADSMKRLWAMDQDSAAAAAYFRSAVRRQLGANFANLGRQRHVVNEVLTAPECAKVSEYAREFTIDFRNTVGNEHGFFSARRGIDHRIILDKYPPSMRYLDFGGSVRHHVAMGHDKALTVAPYDLDLKDPTRATLTRLAMRKVAQDASADQVSRAMASSVLADDRRYHVNETVQTTRERAPVSVAVHVHDVPLQDWPYMMERCDVKVHEGCLHFVNDFFESDEGEFEFSGAHYEIDRGADIFRMRVAKGSSMWYTHKWSDYMRYGANQILTTETGTYSYQIVERRQDTLFYRILRVDNWATREIDQCYALPDVPMVEVDGFEVFPTNKRAGYASRKTLHRRRYLFPQALWERMLTYATGELDRGGLSYDKMFNYYRTVVPRQTINSVHVSGGQKVPMDQVPALVVMAGTVAYADALLLQRTVRAQTDAVMKERSRPDESTIYKFFRVFLDGVVALGYMPLSPFASLPNKITKAYVSLMQSHMASWRPQVRLRPMNVALFLDHKQLSYSVRMPDQLEMARDLDDDAVVRMLNIAAVDPAMAKKLLSVCGDDLMATAKTRLEDVVEAESLAGSTVVGTSTAPSKVGDQKTESGQLSAGVSWHMRGKKKIRRTVFDREPDSTMVTDRRLAVQEALTEVNAEYDAMSDTCDRVWNEVFTKGKPNEFALRGRAEELYSPDLWSAVNGVLTRSYLTPESAEFSYSGVYIPLPDRQGNHLFPVREEAYSGPASATKAAVRRTHYVLPHSYTGYVLVLDGLKVFNGPAVAETLEKVLAMSDDRFLYDVHCYQGPPGCGKTTTVSAQADIAEDIFLTPTRVAKEGLVERLKRDHGVSDSKAWLICRTLDSLLVNYATLPTEAKTGFTRLKIDEYVLSRSGKWHAAAVLLGVSEVHAYGDRRQINHVPRVQVPKFFLHLKPTILDEEFVSHRNCAVILAGYGYAFNNEIRTDSEYEGVFKRVKTFAEVDWMPEARLLSMYQAHKKDMVTVASRVQGKKPVVNTVHEAQGSDCDQVVLYNPELRKRSLNDPFYFYAVQAYCLVAISRARKSVVYVKPSDEPDLITEMIDKAHDVRRTNAVRELSTQGTCNVFLD